MTKTYNLSTDGPFRQYFTLQNFAQEDLPPTMRRNYDKFVVLLSYIFYSGHFNHKTEDGWVYLFAKNLSTYLGRKFYQDILQCAEEIGLIERNMYYVQSDLELGIIGRSRQYKITPKYSRHSGKKSNWRKYVPRTTKGLDKLAKDIAAHKEVYLAKYERNRIIDMHNQRLRTKAQPRKLPHIKEEAFSSVDAITKGLFFFKDDSQGRLYHNIVNTKRELRQYLWVDDKFGLYEIDKTCSHPNLIGWLLETNWQEFNKLGKIMEVERVREEIKVKYREREDKERQQQRESKDTGQQSNEERRNERKVPYIDCTLFYNNRTNSLYQWENRQLSFYKNMAFDSAGLENTPLPSDVREWREKAQEGILYAYLKELSGLSTLTKDEFKKALFYAQNSNDKRCAISKAIAEHFPTVWKFISYLKEDMGITETKVYERLENGEIKKTEKHLTNKDWQTKRYFSRQKDIGSSFCPVYLMGLEAQFMLCNVVDRIILEKGHDVWFTTLHDAIFCTKKDAKYVQSVMRDELDKLGINSKLEIKKVSQR